MKKKKPKARKIRSGTLRKGLTRKAAMRAAVKKWGGDFRGFWYSPKTGYAVLV